MLTKLIRPAFVAGTVLLIAMGAGPPASAHLDSDARPADLSSHGRNPAGAGLHDAVELAVADSFAPTSRRKKKVRRVRHKRRRGPVPRITAPRTTTNAVDTEAAPPPSRRRVPAEEQEEATASGDGEGEEEEEEDRPRPKRRRAAAEEEEEEEEEDDDGPMTGMASVVPRLFSLSVGVSAIGRKFGFDTPMQRENTFPRLGAAATIELFPLLRMSHGWQKRLGVGLTFYTEYGSAVLKQSNGASVSLPVTQRRWFGDVRYAILAGDRVLIVPALGVASDFFDLKTATPGVPPSACGTTSTAPCLADVNSTGLSAGASFRIALTEEVALTLGGAYLLGLATSGGTGQLGAERKPKMSGYTFELGGHMLLSDWLAVRAAIPFTHFGYTFSGGSAMYKSASETYYGLTVSAVVFTR